MDDLDVLIGTELLGGPPSEKLRERAGLMRGSREAREALAAALLAESPDPEALVLLLTILSDDAIASGPKRETLPASRFAWFTEIAARFSDRGIAGICSLALAFPEGRWGWRGTFATFAVGAPPRDAPLAREAAWRCFEAWADDREAQYEALLLLANLGAPAHARARLYALALDEEVWQPARAAAAAAVGRSGEDPTLDSGVVRAARDALGTRDVARFARAVEVGLARGLREAEAIALEGIARFAWSEQDADDAEAELGSAVSHLLRTGLLTEAWSLEAVNRPETGAFALALLQCRLEPPPASWSRWSARWNHPPGLAWSRRALQRCSSTSSTWLPPTRGCRRSRREPRLSSGRGCCGRSPTGRRRSVRCRMSWRACSRATTRTSPTHWT